MTDRGERDAVPAERLAAAGESSDEWMHRRGWLLAAVWLVYLVFPLAELWSEDHPPAQRAAATGLIVVFAYVYVRGFRRRAWWEHGFPSPDRPAALAGEALAGGDRAGPRAGRRLGPDDRERLGHFASLIAIALAIHVLVGPAALSLVSFVVSFAVFHLTWRGAWITFVLGLVTVVAVPHAQGTFGELWFLTLIVAAVGATTMLVRVVGTNDRERAGLQTRVAVSDERNRLARDVHDVLGHSLTAVILKAELCQRLLEGVEPADAPDRDRVAACRHQLAELQAVSRGALAEIRSTVGGLRSATLTDELAVARTVLADAGVDLIVVGDPAAGPRPAEPILPWVVREAVTNIVRHARATRCRIEVGGAADLTDDVVILRIVDDGVGIGPGVEGNGLRGLRERVEVAGARLRIGSGPGGTTVEVLMAPARREAEA